MLDRAFGIEIECSSPFRDHDDWSYDDDDDTAVLTRELLVSNGFVNWNQVGYDGSELEIKSPILRGSDGFKELKSVFHLLNENNFFVTEEDGMHIHHDAPELKESIPAVLRLAKSWKVNQRVIDLLVSEERTFDYDCCPELTDKDIYDLETSSSIPSYIDKKYGERNSLNVCSLSRHGSVEIRQHEGTLDYAIAEAWIKFGQRFIDECIRRKYPLGQASSVEELFEMIRNSKKSSVTLLAKARKKLDPEMTYSRVYRESPW